MTSCCPIEPPLIVSKFVVPLVAELNTTWYDLVTVTEPVTASSDVGTPKERHSARTLVSWRSLPAIIPIGRHITHHFDFRGIFAGFLGFGADLGRLYFGYDLPAITKPPVRQRF
jgi:hypothetical protein